MMNSTGNTTPGMPCNGSHECSLMTSTDNTNPRLINGVINLLLMLINIGGNSLVFYVYRYLAKNTVFSLYVRTLAALDLLSAVTTMLIDIIMKLRPNDENNLNLSLMCKLSHFQVYANSLISGSVLVFIAYQRYRKICHPLKRSIQLRNAKYLLLGISMFCIAICIPTLFVYGKTSITVLMGKQEVQSFICRYDEAYAGKPLQLFTSYFLMGAFSVVLLTTIVLYVMVSRSIRSFERRNSRMSTPTSPAPIMEVDEANAQWDTPAISPVNGRPVTSPVHGRPVKAVNPAAAQAIEAVDRREEKGTSHQTRTSERASIFSVASNNMVSAQMYRVFAIITVVFIISYLPHLLVLILLKVLGLYEKTLTHAEIFFLELAYNCPYISTVANPLVYGFSSSEFRDHLREFFYCDSQCCREAPSRSRVRR